MLNKPKSGLFGLVEENIFNHISRNSGKYSLGAAGLGAASLYHANFGSGNDKSNADLTKPQTATPNAKPNTPVDPNNPQTNPAEEDDEEGMGLLGYGLGAAGLGLGALAYSKGPEHLYAAKQSPGHYNQDRAVFRANKTGEALHKAQKAHSKAQQEAGIPRSERVDNNANQSNQSNQHIIHGDVPPEAGGTQQPQQQQAAKLKEAVLKAGHGVYDTTSNLMRATSNLTTGAINKGSQMLHAAQEKHFPTAEQEMKQRKAKEQSWHDAVAAEKIAKNQAQNQAQKNQTSYKLHTPGNSKDFQEQRDSRRYENETPIIAKNYDKEQAAKQAFSKLKNSLIDSGHTIVEPTSEVKTKKSTATKSTTAKSTKSKTKATK